MYQKAIIMALFVGVLAAGTLVTAISIASPAKATVMCAPGSEIDTKACPNPRERTSRNECDSRGVQCKIVPK